MREKRFREDLFYRLNVIPIRTPPLRERREDIPLLAEHFLERFSREMGKARRQDLRATRMALLVRHSWPGNVRELENVIERAVALETTAAVLPERLPELPLQGAAPSRRRRRSSWAAFSLDDHLRSDRARAPARGPRAGRWRSGGGRPAPGDHPPVAALPDPEARASPPPDKN